MVLPAIGALDFFIFLREKRDFAVAHVTIWCICPRKDTISALMRFSGSR
jgi:hypothetical protein